MLETRMWEVKTIHRKLKFTLGELLVQTSTAQTGTLIASIFPSILMHFQSQAIEVQNQSLVTDSRKYGQELSKSRHPGELLYQSITANWSLKNKDVKKESKKWVLYVSIQQDAITKGSFVKEPITLPAFMS